MSYFANGDTPASLPPELVGSVDFSGPNELTIGEGCFAGAIKLRLSQGARVRIGKRCNLGAVDIFSVGGSIEIGDDLVVNGALSIFNHEAKTIRIGDDCRFAGNTVITTSDMHSIVDAASGERVNAPKDVIVGNRVWVGFSCFILKGSKIADGSVVGAAAVVTASLKVPPNSLIAGNPARVVRRGTTWNPALLPTALPPKRWWRRLW
jgi:acetyltransferase-like isoleucine patch superfamily enzyme